MDGAKRQLSQSDTTIYDAGVALTTAQMLLDLAGLLGVEKWLQRHNMSVSQPMTTSSRLDWITNSR